MPNSKENAEKTSGSKRGFASMDQARQREISSKGGKAAHESGRAHQFDSEQARAAGKKGGSASSRNRENSREDIV